MREQVFCAARDGSEECSDLEITYQVSYAFELNETYKSNHMIKFVRRWNRWFFKSLFIHF